MKKKNIGKQHEDSTLTVSSSLNTSVLEKLQAAKKQLTIAEKEREEKKRQQAIKERKEREENKSFAELLDEYDNKGNNY